MAARPAHTAESQWAARVESDLQRRMLRSTADLVDDALGHYGEPMMSLHELRARLARQLPDTALSEIVAKNRAAGW